MSVAPVVPIDAVVLRAGRASTGSAIGDTCAAAVDGTDIAGSHHLRYFYFHHVYRGALILIRYGSTEVPLPSQAHAAVVQTSKASIISSFCLIVNICFFKFINRLFCVKRVFLYKSVTKVQKNE